MASALRVKELELTSFSGTSFYIATETVRKSRVIPMVGESEEAFSTERILEAVKQAVSPASIARSRMVHEYEAYYIDRQNQQPLPVLYIELNDAGRSAYYIDPRTGKVVQGYGVHARWDRWLYHGLHSMDLPGLYARRPAWDILVIALLLGGVGLSVTSLLIAWKVVRRKFN